MPLINLKTNLTTLKFGKDRRNGGDSGQPYIKTPIIGDRYATQGPPQTLVDYAINNRNSLDYPIRGGGLQYEIGSQTLTISSKIDRERIKKFLEDSPRGTAFIDKQIGLQLTNPKIETGTNLNNTFTNVGSFTNISALPGVLENTRTYNRGQNTLAQVGVSGTGYHLPRAGLFPFDLTTRYYDKVVGAQNRMSADEVALENRLLILAQLKLRTSDQIVNRGSVLGAINKINQLGISLNRNFIQNYLGGPGSAYGIGSTIIRRFDDTTLAVRKTRAATGMTYDMLAAQQINKDKYSDPYNVYTVNKDTYYYPKNLDLQDFKDPEAETIESREQKFGMSYGYTPDGTSQQDLIASNPFFNAPAGKNPWVVDSPTGDSAYGASLDAIKFGFEAVDNEDPTNVLFMQFRAYLTNGITDNHQASYNTFKYMGRGEDFHIYQGFTRTIGFSFRVAVENRSDLLPLYEKLNALASQVYPDYSENGVMRTSLTRVTVGDYIYRMPGFLESVNITVNQDSSWETQEGNQLPHYLDVAISFKPIHDRIPERVKYRSDNQYSGDKTIIHNRIDATNFRTPDPLNEEFYLDRPRDLTEAEERRLKRRKRREDNKKKRIDQRAINQKTREAERRKNKDRREQEKADKLKKKEDARLKKEAELRAYYKREADRITKEYLKKWAEEK